MASFTASMQKSVCMVLAIFLPQRAALSPFIDLSEFPGPALSASPKEPVKLRLDADVLAALRASGEG